MSPKHRRVDPKPGRHRAEINTPEPSRSPWLVRASIGAVASLVAIPVGAAVIGSHDTTSPSPSMVISQPVADTATIEASKAPKKHHFASLAPEPTHTPSPNRSIERPSHSPSPTHVVVAATHAPPSQPPAPAPATPSSEAAAPAASGGAATAVAFALAQVGDSYVWGANGPSSWDCSGLMKAAWAAAGVTLPRVSSSQYYAGTHVSQSELQPGDLVFYYTPISHVGMYIGNGRIVNAENPSVGVITTSLNAMPYVGATRPS